MLGRTVGETGIMGRGTGRNTVRMQRRGSPARCRVLRQAAASSGWMVNTFVLDSACAAAYQMLAGPA